MGEHTPGKWKRSGCLVYALNDLNFNRFSARFDSARQPGQAGAEECEANATLAAAAPELLEALERSLDAMERNIAYAAYKDERALADAIPAARAAIKKARGEG